MSASGTSHTVEGMTIYCRTEGRGAPLLMIHGFLESHRCWEPILEVLRAHFSLVMLDLPGHGESDRPSQYSYTVDAFAHTIAGLMDALGLSHVTMMGHSFGGTLAMAMAAWYPERVERVVAVDPAIYPLRFPLEGRLALLPFVGEILFKRLYSQRDLRRYFRRDVYLDPRLPTEESVQYYWERMNQPGGREAIYRTLQTLAHLETMESLLHRVVSPTLLVWGAQDRMVPLSDGHRLEQAIKKSKLIAIPGSGHAPQEERPEEFCAAVLPFLQA
jgi:pimeloyl-ACP methyl ester carboxylesterase